MNRSTQSRSHSFAASPAFRFLVLCVCSALLLLGCDDGGSDDPVADATTSADTSATGGDAMPGDADGGGDTASTGPSWRAGLDDADFELTDLRATTVLLGDLDGDGLAEIGVFDGTDEAGVLRVHNGLADGGAGARDAAAFSISGLGLDQQIGGPGLDATVGDFDGDGTPDIAATYPAYEDPGADALLVDGGVAIFFGPFDDDRDVSGADRIIRNGSTFDVSDTEALHTANLDGDAIDDLVLERGIDVLMIHGPFDVDAEGAPYSLDANAVTLDGTESSFPSSIAVADFDGDGLDDVAVGDSPSFRSDTSVDAVYVFAAPFTEDRDATMADITFLGDAAHLGFGANVRAVPDQNGDGAAELWVAAVEASSTDAAEHVSGGWVGRFDSPHRAGGPELAAATLTGVANGDRLGTSIAAGDIDGDGELDIVATTGRWQNLFAPAPYTVHVFLGPLSGERAADTADAMIAPNENRQLLGDTGLFLANVAGDATDDLVLAWPRYEEIPASVRIYVGGE